MSKTTRNMSILNANLLYFSKIFKNFSIDNNNTKDIFQNFLKYYDKYIEEFGTDKKFIKQLKYKFDIIKINDISHKDIVYMWTYKDTIIYVGSSAECYNNRYNSKFDERTHKKKLLKESDLNYKESYKSCRLFYDFLNNHVNSEDKKNFKLYCYSTPFYEEAEASFIAYLTNHEQVLLNQKVEEGNMNLKITFTLTNKEK